MYGDWKNYAVSYWRKILQYIYYCNVLGQR